MPQFSHHETMFRAMEEAARQGRPDVAVDMLSATPSVRAYVRAPASPKGMQLSPKDPTKPYPKGTKYIVIVDFGPQGNERLFYVVPLTAVKRVLAQGKTKKPRPVTPGSHHCYLAPEKYFAKYLNAWHLVPPGTQTGGNHTVYIGDELVDLSDIREALTWLNTHMDSEQHDTFTNAMKALHNPLVRWSSGRIYKGLHKYANKPDIRAYLWGQLAEADAVAAVESAGTSSGQGFANQEDTVAVDNHAMAAARKHYAVKGWQEGDKDACKHNPFDLILTRDGKVMHVEVKGTRASFKGIAKPGIKVFLTANEVEHAKHCGAPVPCQSTELFILTDIEIGIASSGEPHVRDFNFSEENLRPIVYRYVA